MSGFLYNGFCYDTFSTANLDFQSSSLYYSGVTSVTFPSCSYVGQTTQQYISVQNGGYLPGYTTGLDAVSAFDLSWLCAGVLLAAWVLKQLSKTWS